MGRLRVIAGLDPALCRRDGIPLRYGHGPGHSALRGIISLRRGPGHSALLGIVSLRHSPGHSALWGIVPLRRGPGHSALLGTVLLRHSPGRSALLGIVPLRYGPGHSALWGIISLRRRRWIGVSHRLFLPVLQDTADLLHIVRRVVQGNALDEQGLIV